MPSNNRPRSNRQPRGPSNPRDGAGSRQQSVPSNRRESTWTNNGREFTLRTTSYNMPNARFTSFSGSIGPSNFSQSGPAAGGFFDAALDLLGGMMAAQTLNPGQPDRSSRRDVLVEDNEYGGLDYGDPPMELDEDGESAFVQKSPRSGSGKNPRRRRGASPSRNDQSSRRPTWQSPGFRGQQDRVSSSHAPNSNPQQQANRGNPDISELQQIADHHRKLAREARKVQRDVESDRRATQAEREAAIEQNQAAERAYKVARDNLRAAEAEARSERHTRRPQSTRDRSERRAPSMANERDDFHSFTFRESDEDDPFSSFGAFVSGQFSGSRFGSLFGSSQRPGFQRSSSERVFGSNPFDAFPIFDEFPGMPRGFFASDSIFDEEPTQPPRRRHRKPRQAGESQRSPPSATFGTPRQRPVLNLIIPAEAKPLFNTYNERWNSLASTDPNIPWPARGSNPNALTARDTIWAPAVNSNVSTWSEELVMKANVQAFYLAAADLSPAYTEDRATGQVQLGLDKASASPAKVKMLVDMLKKERTRWHSDRLGRRNLGVAGGGPNVKLQTDERARAVFHAVCELLEAAQ